MDSPIKAVVPGKDLLPTLSFPLSLSLPPLPLVLTLPPLSLFSILHSLQLRELLSNLKRRAYSTIARIAGTLQTCDWIYLATYIPRAP